MKSVFLVVALLLACISTAKASDLKSTEENSVSLSFSSNNKRYLISRAPSDYLQLKEAGQDLVLNEIQAKQYDWGRVQKLVLYRNNWLWIDGEETDYVAYLDTSNNPPIIHPPVMLPDVYDNKCHFLDRLLGSCIRAQGTYDPSKERIIVNGYPQSIFGLAEKVTYEVIEGKAQLISHTDSSSAHGTDSTENVPQACKSLSEVRP